MNINELKRNKKNRNLILYLRKVVESYRAGFGSNGELRPKSTGTHPSTSPKERRWDEFLQLKVDNSVKNY